MAGKKKIKATELKNVRISYVSYVKNPATDILFDVIKSKDSEIIEDECYSDLINSVGQDGEEKPNKKTFKEMLLSLNPFSKNSDDDLDKENKTFIKEVGGMNIAKKIQETLNSISKRLDTLENNKDNTSDSLIELKKSLEGKEGQEKAKIEAEITLKETLSQVQSTIANYEKQITEIDEKIEDATEDVDVDSLEATKIDKETLVSILKGKEVDMQKEVMEFEKSGSDGTETDNGDGKKTDKNKDNEQTEKLTEVLSEVSKRLDTIENKRQQSNKLTVELDKDVLNEGEMDFTKDKFWGDVF